MSENPNPEAAEAVKPEGVKPEGEQPEERTFTQADIDKAVKERVARERAKFADYDELKTRAGEKATAEERIAALEKQLQETAREALRRRVQAAHGIADEDAELFLTGTDEETLTAQAKRLADRASERKQNNNVVPREGNIPPVTSGDADSRAFLRRLTGRD